MGLFGYAYKMAAHLLVKGEDAADFLQSQFSNDLRPFQAGQSTYGLWLDVKGKIVADSWVLCEGEERFRIFSEKCAGVLIRNQLEHHIIADDVELESCPARSALALIGESSWESPAGPGGAWVLPGRRSNGPSSEWIFPDEEARGRWMQGRDIELVSEEWIQEARMKSGISVVQAEALPGDLPAEVGLEGDGLSFTKGCFLGQEVVARMHHIGRPQRALYLLSGSLAPSELPCAVCNQEGKVLGELRSCLSSQGGWRGVALLKSRFVKSGEHVLLGEEPVAVEGLYERPGEALESRLKQVIEARKGI